MSKIFQLKKRETEPGRLSQSFNKNLPWIVTVLIFLINVTLNSLCEGVRLLFKYVREIKKED